MAPYYAWSTALFWVEISMLSEDEDDDDLSAEALTKAEHEEELWFSFAK